MRKKTKEQVSVSLDIQNMNKIRKLAEKQSRTLSNMVDLLLDQALNAKTILLFIMFMILVGCKVDYPLLDPNSGSVVKCQGNKAIISFRAMEGGEIAEADFYVEDCKEWRRNFVLGIKPIE